MTTMAIECLNKMDVVARVQEELITVRRLLDQCEADRETEVTRRQQTDERLRQVLETNRRLTAQVERGHDSHAVQQQVN